MSSHEQLVRFAELNGRRVAWAAVGEGPPMVMGGWWMSHLELDWAQPEISRLHHGACALPDRRSLRPSRHRALRSRRPAPDEPRRRGRGPCGRCSCRRRRIGRRVRRLGGRADRRAVRGGASAPGRTSRSVWLLSERRRDRGPRRAGDADQLDPKALGTRLPRPGRRVHPQRDGRRARRVRLLSARLGSGGARGAVARGDLHLQRRGLPPARSDHRPRFCTERTTERSRSSSVVSSPPGSQAQCSSPSKAPIISPGTGTRPPSRGRCSNSRASTGPRSRLAPPTDAPRAAADTDLSARELEVLRLVAEGLSDAEIAERLVLSPHTVHRHVANIRTKLGLASRAAAAAHAARLGLL